jgi:hypothetical protein
MPGVLLAALSGDFHVCTLSGMRPIRRGTLVGYQRDSEYRRGGNEKRHKS